MSQPEGSAQEKWQVRTDAGARKIVERIDTYRSESADVARRVVALEERMLRHATFREILAGGVTLLMVLSGGMAWTISRAEDASKDAGAAAYQKAKDNEQAQRELEKFVKTELQDFKRELKHEMQELKQAIRDGGR